MQVCLIPGDGIGGEVIGAARTLLQAIAPDVALVEAPAGWRTFQATGNALPPATLALAQASEAVLFGAAGSPSHPVPGYCSPIVALRRALDVYANIRPVRSLPGVAPPVDLVVVRENTEGLYAGRERTEDNGNTAITERIITRHACERVVHAACDLALQRAALRNQADQEAPPPKLTIVHKANVIRMGDGLFRTVALEVVAQYPALEVEEMLVDVAAMRVAQTPTRFDVLVTTNMFGDILSDVASIHGGGLGLASSANLGTRYALFEPVHGSAPDIAGRGIANPLAMSGCVAMLLNWLAKKYPRQGATYLQRAEHLQTAIATVLETGPHPPDLGGTASTQQVTEAVINSIEQKTRQRGTSDESNVS